MKKFILTLLATAAISLQAQVGKPFPVIAGSTLDGKAVSIPFKNNKYTIVAIAFNRGAEDQLKDWLNPLYNLFIVKDKGTGNGNMDMAEIYDVNFVFVPMISGFKKVANDFKAGTDKEFWPYILDTEKTDISIVQQQLNVSDNKIPYFYVVDKSGKVVAAQSGKFTEDKMDALEDAVE